MKKIEDDQFLDLMTVKTEIRSVCKEPYRSSHESYFFHSFIYLFSHCSMFHFLHCNRTTLRIGFLPYSAAYSQMHSVPSHV